MKSAQDDRLLSTNDVINLIFKMAPRLIKRVYIIFVSVVNLFINANYYFLVNKSHRWYVFFSLKIV